MINTKKEMIDALTDLKSSLMNAFFNSEYRDGSIWVLNDKNGMSYEIVKISLFSYDILINDVYIHENMGLNQVLNFIFSHNIIL